MAAKESSKISTELKALSALPEPLVVLMPICQASMALASISDLPTLKAQAKARTLSRSPKLTMRSRVWVEIS